MPPRRSARRRSGPTPPPTPTPTPTRTQIPTSMGVAAIEEMITQRVVTTVTNFNTERHEGSGHNNHNSHSDSLGNSWICSYKDFSNYKPKNFYGNGGVVELTRWLEKIE